MTWNPNLPDPRPCEECGTLFQPKSNANKAKNQRFCRTTTCMRIRYNRQQAKRRHYKKSIGDIKYCIFCKLPFEIVSGNQKACSPCRAEHGYEITKRKWKKYGTKPKNKLDCSGRICTRCGKDPSPNYFYCPACLSQISDCFAGDEYIYADCGENLEERFKDGVR